MIATEPRVEPTGLYELRDAAKALGVAPSTITRAANALDPGKSLPFRVRKSNGRRVFKGQDLINYWRIIY